jgi:hypothetical protein
VAIKVLPIVLPASIYASLERQARENERDALQQARWLLKQAIRESDPAAAADRPSDSRAAVTAQ